MNVLKFFGVLVLGIVIGAGGLFLIARAQRGPLPASAADNYNACIQDAKIGLFEHKADIKWLEKALAKCAKQYRVERENGQ